MLKSADTLILDSVGKLSNFLRQMDVGNDPHTLRPVEKREIHAALSLILGSAARLADEACIVDFLGFALQRRLNLHDIWVVIHGDRVVWATLPMVSPGRTMLLLAPSGLPRNDGEQIAGSLTDMVCEQFQMRGVQLAQVLLDPTDKTGRDMFCAHAFRQMAELLYLQTDVRRSFPAPLMPETFEWQHYTPDAHNDFADAIVHSYCDSLDCPGLNGLRNIDDVMAGHKASGGAAFDPSLWMLLREKGKPIAVVLLARVEGQDTYELAYLGLIPAARGRGLADFVMRQALHTVTSHRGSMLTLAVDAENSPAIRLYHRHGMKKVGSKLALLRELREPAAPPERTITAKSP